MHKVRIRSPKHAQSYEMAIYHIGKELWMEKLKLKIADETESYVSMNKCESYVRLNLMCV